MLRFYYSCFKLLSLFITISILLISFCSSSAYAISKYGSTGIEVSEIQQTLTELGYYSGEIDGKFGSQTKNAVLAFQKDNNLKTDGIVGEKTLSTLRLASYNNNSSFSDSEIRLLARIISAEARGEPYEGQVAVGAVVLNRISHPSFPNTISGVIFQPLAFSCINDGQFNEPVSNLSIKAANDAINGWDPTGGAIYYYNPTKATNKWIYSRDVICTIGNHKFCL